MRPTPKLALFLALVALALLVPPAPPVVSGLSGEPVPGVGLRLGPAYLLGAPLWGVFDFLTVRTVDEHVAILAGLCILFGAWRLLRRRSRRSLAARVGVETAVAGAFVLALGGFYVAGVLAPRPMAALRVEDPDVVVVDFHSHSDASHDGRPGFTAERTRAWHRGAGFHVAWLTDHSVVDAALEAAARNPARAGDGTVLLPGREVVYEHQHVVALGLHDPREGLPAAPDGTDPCERWPVLIQTIPNDLSRVHPGGCSETGAGVRAIELVDGDPRGLAQGERERQRILALADSLGLIPVAASNLHGWGRTAASWNLIRIPGWREMAPEEVGDRIVELLRSGDRDAVEIVTVRRPAPAPRGRVATAAASVASVADFAARRSRPERLAWLAWLLVGVVAARRLGTVR